MITRIALKDWTSHENTELELKKGANIFIGSMGSGKTSVLEGLCYALYGKIPKSTRNTKIEHFVRFGKSSAKVEVELEANGKKLRVVRELGKKSSAWLYVDGKLYEQSPSKVTSAIERIVGVNYDTFTKAVYAGQNDIDAFVNLTPASRKEAMDRIMGISDLKEMANKARRVENILASRRKEVELNIEGEDINALVEESKKVDIEIERLRGEAETVQKALASKREHLQSVEKRLKTLEEASKKFALLNNEKKRLEGELIALEETLKHKEKLKEEEFVSARLKELSSQIKIAKDEEKAVEEELEKVLKEMASEQQKERRKKEIEEELARISEKNVKRLEEVTLKNLEESSKVLEKTKMEMAGLSQQRKGLLESLKHLSSAEGGECPTCRTVLGEDRIREIVANIEAEVKAIEKNIEDARGVVASLEAKKANLERKLEIIRRLKSKEELLKRQLQQIEIKDIEEMKKEEGKIRESLHNIKKRLEKYLEEERALKEELKEMEKIKRSLEREREAKEMLKKVEEQIGSIEFDENELESARNERIEALKSVKEMEGMISRYDAQTRELVRMKGFLNDKIQKVERAKARKERIEKLLKSFSMIKEGLEEAQGKRRELLIGSLNQAMQNLWGSIYPYDDYTCISIEASRDDYKFWIHNEAEKFPLERVASGGEKTSFAIALRVALSIILTDKLHWLILDEPTHNLDENAIHALGEIVRKRLPGMVEQFIIVTHDARLKNADMGRVFVFDRGEGKTSPTKVSILDS